MKKLAIILGLLSFNVTAQKTIRSIKLDSAIFNEIAKVRRENNQPSVLKFFYGTIRDFSYTVTEKNCDSEYFEHSPMDSTRKYCNAECIYRFELVFGDASKYDVELHPESISNMSKNAVDAWMASPPHRWAILLTWNRSFTITSQIEIAADNKSAILSVSYHSVQHTDNIYEIPIGLRSNAAYYMK
jgi:hypothetical protein